MDPDSYPEPLRPLMRAVAARPPQAPARPGSWTLSIRVPTVLYDYVRRAAHRDGISRSEYLTRLIVADRDHNTGTPWPSDVEHWLAVQAALLGHVGDLQGALDAVLRFLADTYPQGALLEAPA